VYLQEVQRADAERAVMDADLEFLAQQEPKFDPVDQLFDQKTGNLKR